MSPTPGALGVPEHARREWEQLHAQILATGPTPCAGPDRDHWTGTPAQQDRAADRCLGCAALEQCLTYALAADETGGVWGGRSARERTTRQETA